MPAGSSASGRMTTVTAPTITEFLLARIAEDEAAATALRRAMVDKGRASAFHDRTVSEQRAQWPSFWRAFDRYPNPARVLAECEAKRRIVERHSWCDDASYGDASTCPDMRALAAVYADHPDYDEGWRAE